MFKIENNTIKTSRGDAGTITLKIPYTDNNGYLKYEDGSSNVYWYDKNKGKLYDADYEESSTSLDTLTLQLYQFQANDKIKLNVYEKKGYDKEPLMTKTTNIVSTTDEATISLYEADTSFGEIANKEITYWYDITLNDDTTVVCYNEDGAMPFIVYPAKGVDE